MPLQFLEAWTPPEIGELSVALYAPKSGNSAEQGKGQHMRLPWGTCHHAAFY